MNASPVRTGTTLDASWSAATTASAPKPEAASSRALAQSARAAGQGGGERQHVDNDGEVGTLGDGGRTGRAPFEPHRVPGLAMRGDHLAIVSGKAAASICAGSRYDAR